MENDSMALLLDCLKTCQDIERSPYGQENPDVRVDELFKLDLLGFLRICLIPMGQRIKKKFNM